MLSEVLSPRREIFRPSEEVFSPRREYFRSGKNKPYSLDYFRPSDNFFRSGEGYFRPGEIGLAQAKKRIFLFFSFLFLNV